MPLSAHLTVGIWIGKEKPGTNKQQSQEELQVDALSLNDFILRDK